MDVDGKLISKYCPKRMCVYLISQLTGPIAVINERLSEGLPPDDFHFMRYVRCPDVGVQVSPWSQSARKRLSSLAQLFVGREEIDADCD